MWPFIKRQTSDILSDKDWYNKWQPVVKQETTSDNKLQRGTTSDTKWPRVTINDKEWQQMVILANFPFFNKRGTYHYAP